MQRAHAIAVLSTGVALVATLFVMGGSMATLPEDLPRNQKLLLFQPHTSTFDCTAEATKLPVVDAQAHAWFREARALEAPSMEQDPDYAKIIRLTRQAAERRHWQAMLNLASFYVEGLDPKHGVEDAVKLVEEGMRLGVPAAYDRMGTYYMNGTGVPQDATGAYAFWQKAAQLGNPDALAYLGEKLSAGQDGAGHWANIPIAQKMMECAVSQGHGPVAYELKYMYREFRDKSGKIIGDPTVETKARALTWLHEGVKHGCEDCARSLAIEFGRPFDLDQMLPPYVDKARGKRYDMLNDAMHFNRSRRFPNLDKILPLPPADLPPWDGTRDSLLKAAMGVTFSPDLPPEIPRPANDRYFVDPAYYLRKTAESTDALKAPFAGYWQPHVDGKPVEKWLPGLYGKDESFNPIYIPDGWRNKPLSGISWVYHVTVRNSEHEVDPVAVPGLTRKVPRPAKSCACRSHEACPIGGIWQPWVPESHPLQSIVNQPWRQVFLRKEQPFPQPRRDWLLDLDEKVVTWHLMEETGPGMVAKDGG
jgi:uncharacterized protein